MGLFISLFDDPLGIVMTRGARIALPFIISGVHNGLSGNQLFDTLRLSGMGLSRSSLYKVVRVLNTQLGLPAPIRGRKAADYPHPSLFRVAPFPTTKNYTFTFHIQGWNPLTRQFEDRHINIISNRLLTTQEAEDRAQDLIDASDDYPLEDVDIELTQVLVSPFLSNY